MNSEPTSLSLEQLCGQLLVCGFDGTTVPQPLLRAFQAGERGGAIVFRRNLPDLETTQRLNLQVVDACPEGLPPLIGVDEEGGRVARLPSPAPRLPPARELGTVGEPVWIESVAEALGRELRALGFNLDFAPVLDVDTHPHNPIIGDRAFAKTPAEVAASAVAFARGLARGGVMACGKHFPGHGHTTKDSHLDLPEVDRALSLLRAVELAPFRAAVAARIPALMSAHVLYTDLDPDAPATLSHRIATELLRDELGYDGLFVSDDLEMKALADRDPIERTAVRAVRAGCDVLLICHSVEWQERAHGALVREANRDPVFHRRCLEAAHRSLVARRRCPPRPSNVAAALSAGEEVVACLKLRSLGASN